MAMISDNISRIQKDIAAVCQRLGRSPKDITVIGVTKYGDVEAVKQVVTAGITHIGENRVQDAKEKIPFLGDLTKNLTTHMIGHLQTNKVKEAIEIFDVIQSVDSVKLAEEIERQAEKIDKEVKVLIQVNTSGEPQKFGVNESEVVATVKQVAELPHIRILGLMTIASFTDDKNVVRGCFQELKKIQDTIAKEFKGHERVSMQYLSMGMTSDYEIALEEGSNMVRIGRAIFSN